MPKDKAKQSNINNIDPNTKSNALKQKHEADSKDPITPSLNADQQNRLRLNWEQIKNAQNQRNEVREEFDDMTYEQDYFYNKRAANAYLPKKANDDEVRVNTGTIEKKVEVLINELISINLQPEATAYDMDDNEIRNLGSDIIDIVKRTNQIEKDDDFWIDFVKELLSQRAVFIEEKDVNKKYFTTNIKRAEKKLWSGLRVYLGDINIPARLFQTQPYIVLYTRRSYAEAQTVYGTWDRWDFVHKGMWSGSKENPFGYRMNNVNNDEVEEIHIINPIANEYDIIINGIPMMMEPEKCPWELTPERMYNMQMITIKPMDTDFAYGKHPVASAKFLQGLKDETIRLMVRKFRQAVEPPLGVKKGSIYSKDVWSPGSVTQGMGNKDFERLIDHNGVTQSEYNMFDLIEKKTEEFVGAGTLGGESQPGEQTATEVNRNQINSIKNLGLLVVAFSRAKRDMSFLRIANILENFVKPKRRTLDPYTKQLTNVFNKFTINNVIFEDGTKGKKVVQFVDKPLTDTEREDIFSFEEREAELGRPIRIRAVNIKLLKSVPLFWNINVTSQPRDGSQLSKVLFKDKLAQGAAIEQASQGQKRVNWDVAAEDFETTWDAKDFFQKEAPRGQQATPGEGGEQAQGLIDEIEGFERSQAGSQLTEVERRPNQAPSINRLEDNIQ